MISLSRRWITSAKAISSVCTKLDRLARSVGDLLDIVARLEAKKVWLRVLSMSGAQPLDTGTAIGRLMLAVIGAVGQAEQEAMLERQREGIAKAKARGALQGPCADRPTAGWRDHPAQGGRRQALGNRQQTGDRQGQRVSGAWSANRQRSDGPSPPRYSTQATWKEL